MKKKYWLNILMVKKMKFNKKILIVALSNLSRSPRPLKQIEALKDHYEIDTIGLKKSGFERNFYQIKKETLFYKVLSLPLLLLRLYNYYYWDKNKKQLKSQMVQKDYDLIIVHEVRMLPLVFSFKGQAKIILDAHEYSPNNFDDSIIWRILFKHFYIFLCEKYLDKCNKVITVCEEISKLYSKNFSIKCSVITNAADYIDLKPSSVNPKKIKIIHHGIAGPSRKLELMIEMMGHLDERFELYLMLVAKRTNQLYLKKLKRLSRRYKNIHFLNPVPYSQITNFSNQFDIGLLFFPPTNLNLKFCLPNKLFEFIQSRLCIVSGPSIEIKKYINRYKLGFVSDSFEPQNMAKKLNSLTSKKIDFYKNNTNDNAKNLSSTINKEKILDIVKNILK